MTTAKSLTGDQTTRLAFSVYENPGVYALLLGSGLSRAAGIPTGWEITLDLIRRIALARGVDDQPDWEKWYRGDVGEEPDYSKIVGELGLSRNERRAILHSYIEPTSEDREEGRKLPTAAHFAVADLVRDGFVKVIITTNFDRLLENALRERGVEPTIVGSVDALEGAEPLTHSQCFLLKLHGDYKDARILNTDAELSGYPGAYDALLDRIFDEHGLVVCGWSGEWDHALRYAILRSKSRRYSLYWGSRGTPGEGAQELIAHRAGQLIPIQDADSFLSNLRNQVETLKLTHRREPRSVDLLVASAKRYLPSSKHRIQIDELFSSENEAYLIKLAAMNLRNMGNISAGEVRRRVEIYEALAEPLAKMAFVLGRWGAGDEQVLVQETIAIMCAEADEDGAGYTDWIELRYYPAVLVLAAYGIGLVRSRRWFDFHSIMSSYLKRRFHSESMRLVDHLFLNAWPGGRNEFWWNIEGLERHKTAFSDHLYQLLLTWSQQSIGLTPNFVEVFETWEILGALVHFEKISQTDLDNLEQSSDRRDYVFMPLGRSAWDQRVSRDIFASIESGALRQELLAAGFARVDASAIERDEAFLDSTLKNFGRIAAVVASPF